jgi:hypothetical protein
VDFKKITTTVFIACSFIACSEDDGFIKPNDSKSSSISNVKETKSKKHLKSSSILSDIIDDINSGVNYTDVSNEYGYSGEDLENFILDAYELDVEGYSDSLWLDSLYKAKYVNYGYSTGELQNQLNNINSYYASESSFEDVIEDVNIDEPNNSLEVSILDELFNHYQTANSYAETKRICDIFTHHISNSAELSAKEKKDILTQTSVLKSIRSLKENDAINWFDYTLVNSTSDPNYLNPPSNVGLSRDTECAAHVLIPMGVGAATGNGPGAAGGIILGLWSAYQDGCMD